ncbi:hypothetical protein RJO15_17980 [Herbaspirillum huttiense F1]|uniref:hypothetical protein n=1 Tax=Herbaspirillum sp. 1130 TaxID=2806562 RepID=UPI001AE70349|nr:hypothetical protein [Herbaspirillum sp. 1130]MDT0357682.1 hypothetical protein [Herbaspirillum huttiense F1]
MMPATWAAPDRNEENFRRGMQNKANKKNRRQKPAVKRTGDAHPLTAAFRAKLILAT